jgi:hypothetical protein
MTPPPPRGMGGFAASCLSSSAKQVVVVLFSYLGVCLFWVGGLARFLLGLREDNGTNVSDLIDNNNLLQMWTLEEREGMTLELPSRAKGTVLLPAKQ